MMYITHAHLDQFLEGTALLGTGGGLPARIQRPIFDELLRRHHKLPVISLSELPDDYLIATAYGVGSTEHIPASFGETLQQGMELLQQKLGNPISGIFPGESNIEALTFQVAMTAGVPVVDADGTGGRAVPLLSIDNTYLHGTTPLPALVMSLDGAVLWIDAIEHPTMIERLVRTLQQEARSKTLVVFDHVMTVKEAKRILTQGTIRLAIALRQGQHPLRVLHSGTVTDVQLATNPHSGLFEGTIHIDTFTVHVRNEFLAVEETGTAIVTAPDLIMLREISTQEVLHSSAVTSGQHVELLSMSATAPWRTPTGQALFNLAQFSIPLPTTLLPPL